MEGKWEVWRDGTYRNVIDMASIRSEDDSYPCNNTEHVGDGPPWVIGIASLYIGEDGRDKRD